MARCHLARTGCRQADRYTLYEVDGLSTRDWDKPGGAPAGNKFDRILRSLHDVAFEDAVWPATAGLIDDARGLKGNHLEFGAGSVQWDTRIFFARFCSTWESMRSGARAPCRAARATACSGRSVRTFRGLDRNERVGAAGGLKDWPAGSPHRWRFVLGSSPRRPGAQSWGIGADGEGE